MYTKQNLESIEKAIGDMQAGRRVVGASYGDTRVQYANITLDELINLRNRIKSGIEDSESESPTIYIESIRARVR
jgi:hypothetical protein